MRNRVPPRLAGGTKKSQRLHRGLLERAKQVQSVTREGYDVSKSFPWYRTGITQGTGVTANRATPIVSSQVVGGAFGESAFKNDTDDDIEVRRFTFLTFGVNDDFLARVGVKIESEKEDIIKKWLPITSLHTDPHHYLVGSQHQGIWVLPTPYFLQAGHTFTGRIIAPPSATPRTKELTITLRGYNPIDFDPIIMATTTTFPAAGYNTFSFTENRDGPLRDMIIEEISVGLSDVSDDFAGLAFFLNQVFILFEPPEGPKWSQDIRTPFCSLSTQMSVYGGITNGFYQPIVVHEPTNPIILSPGQSIKMSVLPFETEQSAQIIVTALGTQRGKRTKS